MFGGIGAFSLALGRQNHDCVGYYDWEKTSVSVYNRNFGTDHKPTDITKLDARNIPDHDLLCAGFPCQAFSFAGDRRGFEDTRGTLFFEIARIAKHKRPRLLLLENVKGILSHDGGRTVRTILDTLGQLGYWWEYEVLNSKNFGVPQNRERIFIVGHLAGERSSQVFPLQEGDREDSGNVSSRQVSTCLDANYGKGWRDHGQRTMIHMVMSHAPRSGNPKQGGTGPLVSSAKSFALDTQPHYILQVNQQNKVYAKNHVGADCANMNTKQTLKVVMRQPLRHLKRNQKNFEGDYAFTVDTAQTRGLRINDKIRRLTPTECERLMGFPDGWTEFGQDGKRMSDTARYKMLGNAIVVPVVEEIGRWLA